MTTSSPRKRRGCAGCVVASFCGVAALLLTVFVVYWNANRPFDIVVSQPPIPANNAYDDFVRVGVMFTNLKHKSPIAMMVDWKIANRFENYKACAIEAEPGMDILRLALNKQCLSPAIRSFDDPHLDDYAKFRTVSRTIAGVAGYFERIGQYGKAVDTLLDGYEMAVMIPHGASLLGYLAGGNACEYIVTTKLEPLLPHLSSSELSLVAMRLERTLQKRVAYGDIVQEYGREVVAGWQKTLRESKDLKPSLQYYQNSKWLIGRAPTDQLTMHDRIDLTKFLVANKRELLRDNLAYYEALSKEVRETVYTGKSATVMPKNLIKESTIADLGEQTRGGFECLIAINNLILLEVALTRYHLENKHYPTDLNLLRPKHMHNLPVDPFSGPGRLPFRYSAKNGGNGYQLYSLGPDLKDDGGSPMRRPFVGNPGDIVAGKLWRQIK